MGHRFTSEMLFAVASLITILMIIGWVIYFRESPEFLYY